VQQFEPARVEADATSRKSEADGDGGEDVLA
jgi:hypothetical protein